MNRSYLGGLRLAGQQLHGFYYNEPSNNCVCGGNGVYNIAGHALHSQLSL